MDTRCNNKKNKVIIFGLIIFGVMSVIVYSLSSLDWPSLKKGDHIEIDCSDEVNKSFYYSFGTDTELLACFGVITVDKWYSDLYNEARYELYDHRNKYSLGLLKGKGSYIVIAKKIYFVQFYNSKFNTISFDDGKPHYWEDYFIDGKLQQLLYGTSEELPKYVSVDINSGEVTLYSNNLEQIPESERKIFQELGQKTK